MKSIEVINAQYIKDYKINVGFSDNTTRIVDFETFLKDNPHPQWEKYINLQYFKKFKIENGNLVWGRNWDLIFPIYSLYIGNLQEQCC